MRSRSFLYGIILLFAIIELTGCGCTSTSGGGGGGGSNSTTITVTFTGANPTVVATQIGSGAYTLATLSGNTLTFSVPSGTSKFAVAYLCPTFLAAPIAPTTFYTQNILMATTADGTSFTGYCLAVTSPLANLTGFIDATAIAGTTQVCAYSAKDTNQYGGCLRGNQQTNFTMPAAQGTDNVLLTATDDNLTVLGIKTLSSQPVPGQLNNGNVVTFTTGDQTTPTNITYNNAPNGSTPKSRVIFIPSWGSSGTALEYQATTSYPAVPNSLLTGHAEYLFISGAVQSATPPLSGVEVISFASTTAPINVNFPDGWTNCPAPTNGSQLTFNFSGYTGFNGKQGTGMVAELSWDDAVTSSSYSYNIEAFNDAVSGAQIVMPDLTSVNSNLIYPKSTKNALWSEYIEFYSSGQFNYSPANSNYATVSCDGLL